MSKYNDNILTQEGSKMISYSRRSFIKTAAAAIICIGAPMLPSPGSSALPLAAGGDFDGKRLIRGTVDGQILESRDNGASWHVCIDFGSECMVKEIHVVSQGLIAEIEHKGLSFIVQSRDGHNWLG